MIFLQEFVYDNSQENSFQNSQNLLSKLIKTMQIWSLANSPVMRVIKIWVFVKSVYIGFELVMIIKYSWTYGWGGGL